MEEVFDYESPAVKPEDVEPEAVEPEVQTTADVVPVKRTKALRGVFVDAETGERYPSNFEGLAPSRVLDFVVRGKPVFVPAD